MQPIAIVGYGGLGREIALLIHQINLAQPSWNLIGFFDDHNPTDTTSFRLPYLGPVNKSYELDPEVALVIGVGTPSLRKNLANPLLAHRNFPNLFHPTAVYSEPNCQIGVGNVITSHCSFTTGITIGNFNLFNTKITIGHDVTIGDFNVFNPTVCISGHVQIGNSNLFGVNSVVLQNRFVGNNNILAAGSVLMSPMRNGETWLGVPALKVE